jgi:hypothetical protein
MNYFRRLALVALVAAMLLPNVAGAQSTSDSDTLVTSVEESPAVEDATPVEVIQDAPPPQVSPSWVSNAIYLARLSGARGGWLKAEYRFGDIVRQQRLGTLNPAVATVTANTYPRVVEVYEASLSDAPPPPQFAHVHQLHLSAAAEFRAATDAAASWLRSGDSGSLRIAQTHFDRMDGLIGQALAELG